MLYAVIMAGGSGTRFWPRSRRSLPKHHLAIAGEDTMLQQACGRLEAELPPEHILVVTVADQVEETVAQLPQLPPENVIAEPKPRNTAAAVGLAAVHVAERGDDPLMLVVTADHVIRPTETFWDNIRLAAQLAEDGSSLVIFGIKPTWGNPGFGYILRGKPADEINDIWAFNVAKFEEKPAPEVAAEWSQSGNYYWNSGMFVWQTSTILRELKQHAPEIYSGVTAIREAIGSPVESAITSTVYGSIPKLPIDKAVMEKSSTVKVIEATFEWDDVGSWKALPNHHAQDEDGNAVIGKHLGLETRGCIIAGEPRHLVATFGIEDLIIVQTRDATLVCHKDDAENVKRLVEKAKADGLEDYL